MKNKYKMKKEIKLSLIIPYYNDVGCPTPFVNELKNELKSIDYEIILVDDCSTDNTLKELKTLEGDNIKIIHNEKNKDYGGAIQTGLSQSKGEILGWTCGDGEVTAKDVAEIYKQWKDSDSILKAIRKNRQDGLNRMFISRFLNIWSKVRFGSELKNIKDINGYPVFFRKEDYQKASNIRTDWIFNIDLFRKMIAKGCTVREIPVWHKKRSAGASHMNPIRIVRMVIGYMKYK
jgi:glycosyltransferase involved in cell wall biosynthesis